MLCLVYGKLILKYGLLQSVAIYNIAYHFFSLSILLLSNDDDTIPPPFEGYSFSK